MSANWPSMTAYVDAIQDPSAAFGTSLLARADFATVPPLDLPATASGQNAVVFAASVGRVELAVRCFTTPNAGGEHRYKALRQALTRRPVPAFAPSVWVDGAVDVEGSTWPIVSMEWIDGKQLHDHVADHLGRPEQLMNLAGRWVALMEELDRAGVAHGDLQHGNVLVEPSGSLRLIDFDEVWLAEIADVPPDEHGHPNYQHPHRAAQRAWGPWIDGFSSVVILLSLRAVAADPDLWDFHDGENLLLTADDLAAAGAGSTTPVWDRLAGSPDDAVVAMTAHLRAACTGPVEARHDLRTFVEPIVDTTACAAAQPAVGSPAGPAVEPPREPDGPVVHAWWADTGDRPDLGAGGDLAELFSNVFGASGPATDQPTGPPGGEIADLYPDIQALLSALEVESAASARRAPSPPVPRPPRSDAHDVAPPPVHVGAPPMPASTPPPSYRPPATPDRRHRIEAFGYVVIVVLLFIVGIAVADFL